MTTLLEKTLPTRVTTVGHWRFRSSLDDASGAGNDLSPVLIRDYRTGISETGLTALAMIGNAGEGAQIPSGAAGDFDFGSSSFSVEIIHRPIRATDDWCIRKNDGGTPATGFQIGLTTGGGTYNITIYLGDGASYAIGQSSRVYLADGNGQWEYWAIVVDRTAQELRLYVDGIEDANSPWSISAVGSISAASSPLLVADKYSGDLDEICVSGEPLTADEIAARARDRQVVVAPHTEDTLLRFLPPPYQSSAVADELLLPVDAEFFGLEERLYDLSKLVRWDLVPPRFMPHLATLFNFELPQAPIFTDDERRRFLKWMGYIVRWSGTIKSVEKLIELCGFAATLVESHPGFVPLIVNQHKVWSPDDILLSRFYDDFEANLSQWQPNTGVARWRLSSGSLIGVGNGAFDPRNCLLFTHDGEDFYAKTTFRITSGGTYWYVGFYIWYTDENDYLLVAIEKVSGTTWLTFRHPPFASSVTGLHQIVNLNMSPTLIADGNPHTLELHWRDRSHSLSATLDGLNLVIDHSSYTPPGHSHGYKGLAAIHTVEVEYDEVTVDTHARKQAPILWTDSFNRRDLGIILSGSPTEPLLRRQYLGEVIPHYLPFGVKLAWLYELGTASVGLNASGLTVQLGYILDGAKGAAFAIEADPTFTIEKTASEYSNLAPAEFGLLAEIAPILKSFAGTPVTIGLNSNGAGLTLEWFLNGTRGYGVDASIGSGGNVAIYTSPYIHNRVLESFGNTFLTFGAYFPDAPTIETIILYDVNDDYPDGMHSSTGTGLLAIGVSQNSDPMNTITAPTQEQFLVDSELTRTGNQIIVTLATPVSGYHFVIRIYPQVFSGSSGGSRLEFCEIKFKAPSS